MWPMLLDYSREECKRILRKLELEAYSSIITAFRAQGELTKEKKKLLQDLSSTLSISTERHRAEIRRAVNDEKLNTVAETMGGSGTSSEWAIEGRRLIPLMPRLVPQTVFTSVANNSAEVAIQHNSKLSLPSSTGHKRAKTCVESSKNNSSSSNSASQSNKSISTISSSSNVVVLPSGMSIQIKESNEHDTSIKCKKFKKPLDHLSHLKSSPIISSSWESSSSYNGLANRPVNIPFGSSPVKVSYGQSSVQKSSSGHGSNASLGLSSQKVIIVTTSATSLSSSILQKSLSLPVVKTVSATKTTASPVSSVSSSSSSSGSYKERLKTVSVSSSKGKVKQSNFLIPMASSSSSLSIPANSNIQVKQEGLKIIKAVAGGKNLPKGSVTGISRGIALATSSGHRVITVTSSLGTSPKENIIVLKANSKHGGQLKFEPAPASKAVKQALHQAIAASGIKGNSNVIVVKQSQLFSSEGNIVGHVVCSNQKSVMASSLANCKTMTISSSNHSTIKTRTETGQGSKSSQGSGSASKNVSSESNQPNTLLADLMQASGIINVNDSLPKNEPNAIQEDTSPIKTLVSQSAVDPTTTKPFIVSQSAVDPTTTKPFKTPTKKIESIADPDTKEELEAKNPISNFSDDNINSSLPKIVSPSQNTKLSMENYSLKNNEDLNVVPDTKIETMTKLEDLNLAIPADENLDGGCAASGDGSISMDTDVRLSSDEDLDAQSIELANNEAEQVSQTPIAENSLPQISSPLTVIENVPKEPPLIVDKTQNMSFFGDQENKKSLEEAVNVEIKNTKDQECEAFLEEIVQEIESQEQDRIVGTFPSENLNVEEFVQLDMSQVNCVAPNAKDVSPQETPVGAVSDLQISAALCYDNSSNDNVDTLNFVNELFEEKLSSDVAEKKPDVKEKSDPFVPSEEVVQPITEQVKADSDKILLEPVTSGIENSESQSREEVEKTMADPPLDGNIFVSISTNSSTSFSDLQLGIPSSDIGCLTDDAKTPNINVLDLAAGNLLNVRPPMPNNQTHALTEVTKSVTAPMMVSQIIDQSTTDSQLVPNIDQFDGSNVNFGNQSLLAPKDNLEKVLSRSLPSEAADDKPVAVLEPPTMALNDPELSFPTSFAQITEFTDNSCNKSFTTGFETPSADSTSIVRQSLNLNSDPVLEYSSRKCTDSIDSTTAVDFAYDDIIVSINNVPQISPTPRICPAPSDFMVTNFDDTLNARSEKISGLNVTVEQETIDTTNMKFEDYASQKVKDDDHLMSISSFSSSHIGAPIKHDSSTSAVSEFTPLPPDDEISKTKRKRKMSDKVAHSNAYSGHVASWMRSAMGLLQRVSKIRGAGRSKADQDAAHWFLDPVSEEDVPDYYTIIKEPMDFSTIKSKLENGRYSSMSDFHKDMLLVKTNCETYNPPKHPARLDCDEVFSYYISEYNKLMEKWQRSHILSSSPKKIKTS